MKLLLVTLKLTIVPESDVSSCHPVRGRGCDADARQVVAVAAPVASASSPGHSTPTVLSSGLLRVPSPRGGVGSAAVYPHNDCDNHQEGSLIAAALFGLDIGPFIGRPLGRLCDGLCVLDAAITLRLNRRTSSGSDKPHRRQ